MARSLITIPRRPVGINSTRYSGIPLDVANSRMAIDVPTLDLDPSSTSWTLSMWLYPEYFLPGVTPSSGAWYNVQVHGQKQGTGSQARNWIGIPYSEAPPTFSRYTCPFMGLSKTCSELPRQYEWQLISLVYNKTAQTLKWYFNGILTDTYTSYNITDSANGMHRFLASRAGGNPDTLNDPSRCWNGGAGPIWMYSRALSDPEVLAQYRLSAIDRSNLEIELLGSYRVIDGITYMIDTSDNHRTAYLVYGASVTDGGFTAQRSLASGPERFILRNQPYSVTSNGTSNNKLQRSNSILNGLIIRGNMSFGMWFYPREKVGMVPNLVYCGNGSSSLEVDNLVYNLSLGNDNKFTVSHEHGASISYDTTFTTISNAWDWNTWNFVIFVRNDSTKTYDIYNYSLNGTIFHQQFSYPYSPSGGQNSNFVIGQAFYNIFLTMLVEFNSAFITTDLLTSGDVSDLFYGKKQLWKNENGIYSSSLSNLIGLWPMDDGSGLTVNDRSGLGNNLTINEMDWTSTNVQSKSRIIV